MTLRVAVDATAIPERRAGAGNYVIELLRAVSADAVDLHVFAKQTHEREISELVPTASIHVVAISSRMSRIVWTHTLLPKRVRGVSADVFFGPHYEVPTGLVCPSVVTFHDPTFFTHPELHERKKVVYFKRAARNGVRRAAEVISPSEYAKRGAVEQAGADTARVHVVHHGVDLDAYRPNGGGETRPYVLFVGTLEPRKDIPTLIAAFEQLETPHELVLVGQRGWRTASIDAAIASANPSSVRWLGYVDECEKIALYQGAAAFVYPSIAEGFGLPVLEAMACGIPVVTTTGSAHEEIAADAALFVPPGDRDALRDAIGRVLTDRSLRAALGKRGRERAETFTWAAAAEATTEVWRRAAASR